MRRGPLRRRPPPWPRCHSMSSRSTTRTGRRIRRPCRPPLKRPLPTGVARPSRATMSGRVHRPPVRARSRFRRRVEHRRSPGGRARHRPRPRRSPLPPPGRRLRRSGRSRCGRLRGGPSPGTSGSRRTPARGRRLPGGRWRAGPDATRRSTDGGGRVGRTARPYRPRRRRRDRPWRARSGRQRGRSSTRMIPAPAAAGSAHGPVQALGGPRDSPIASTAAVSACGSCSSSWAPPSARGPGRRSGGRRPRRWSTRSTRRSRCRARCRR